MRIVAYGQRWRGVIVSLRPPHAARPTRVRLDGTWGDAVTGRALDLDGRPTRARWYFHGATAEWPFPPWVTLVDVRRPGPKVSNRDGGG